MHVVNTASLPAAGSSWVPGQACSPSLRWSSVLPTAAPALLSASTCSASGLAALDTPSTSTLSSWRSLGSAATSCCGRPGCAWQAGLPCTCRCRHFSQCLKQEKEIGCRAGTSSHAITWATEGADQQTTIMYAKLQVRAWLVQDNSWQGWAQRHCRSQALRPAGWYLAPLGEGSTGRGSSIQVSALVQRLILAHAECSITRQS